MADKTKQANIPDEDELEGTTDEFKPVTAPTAPGSLEGDLTLGEHSGTPQPPAGIEVPARAAPAQDAVSVNNHLYGVLDRLEAVIEYVRTHLSNHPAAKDVLSNTEAAKNTVSENLKV